MTTTTTYDPEQIALACLASRLAELVDLDLDAVEEICGDAVLPVPASDNDEGWDRVYAALSGLADRARAHIDIQE